LWKFIEPNSPPITQKLLPLVIVSLLLPADLTQPRNQFKR
jgi:hypothetical protein